MVWVRSEYAGELAVVFTWLSALLPWSVSGVRADIGPTVTVVNVRFVFLQFHYLLGVAFGDQSLDGLVQFVHEVPSFVPADQRLAALVWVAAAAVYLPVFLCSFLYYAREEEFAGRLPADPVRFFGAGLGVVAVLLGAASALYFPRQFTVPLGTLFIAGFAVLLLRVERA